MTGAAVTTPSMDFAKDCPDGVTVATSLRAATTEGSDVDDTLRLYVTDGAGAAGSGARARADLGSWVERPLTGVRLERATGIEPA